MSIDPIKFPPSNEGDYKKNNIMISSATLPSPNDQFINSDPNMKNSSDNNDDNDNQSSFIVPPNIVSSFMSSSHSLDHHDVEKLISPPQSSNNELLLSSASDIHEKIQSNNEISNKRSFDEIIDPTTSNTPTATTNNNKKQQITQHSIDNFNESLEKQFGESIQNNEIGNIDMTNENNFDLKTQNSNSMDNISSPNLSYQDSIADINDNMSANGSKNLDALNKSKIIKFTPNRTTENIKKPHLLLTNPNTKKSKREPIKGPPKNSRFFKVYNLENSKSSKSSSVHHYNPYRYPQNRSKLNPNPDFLKNKKDSTDPNSKVDALSQEALDSIPIYTDNQILELRPTIEEFEDIYAYIDSIKEIGEKYGAVKIIPPKEFSPKFAINLESFWIKSNRQLWRSPSDELNARCEFYKQLQDSLQKTGTTSINKLPCIDKRAIDLYRLYRVVNLRGGFDNCCNDKLWAQIGRELGFYGKISSSLSSSIKSVYQKYITPWENNYKDKDQDFLNLARNDEKYALFPKEENPEASNLPVILGSSLPFSRNRKTLINAGFTTYYDQATTQKKGITLNDLNTLPDYDFYRWFDPSYVDDTIPTELKISSLYTLKQFYDKSRILKSQVLNKFYELDHNKFENLNYLENTFWDLLENPNVMFETEVSLGQNTSIHDSSNENKFLSEKNGNISDSILGSLNFNNSTIADGSVLQYVQSDSESIFNSNLNFCMFYGAQSWCMEDHWFYNIDYHYLGDAKSVYVIPPEYQEKYEELLKSKLGLRGEEYERTSKTYKLFETEITNYDIYSACVENQVTYDMHLPKARPNDLVFELLTGYETPPTRFNSDIMFSPKVLKENGIPVYQTFQEVGDMIIKFPKAYTSYFSLGTCVTESVNIANADWLNVSLNVSKWLQSQKLIPRFSTFLMMLTTARESKDLKTLKILKPILEGLVSNEINKRNEVRKLLKEIKFEKECTDLKCINEFRKSLETGEDALGGNYDYNHDNNANETVGTKLASELGTWNKVTDLDLVDMFPTFVSAKKRSNTTSNFTMSLDSFIKFDKENAPTNTKFICEMVSLVTDEYLYETINILNNKLGTIEEWIEKYHKVLNEHSKPSLDIILPIFKHGETLFDEKNIIIDNLSEFEKNALEEFNSLKIAIDKTEEWKKKVRCFFNLRNKDVNKLFPFSGLKKLVEEMKILSIFTNEMKDILNLANEISEFDELASKALSKGKDNIDLEELRGLHIVGSDIKVQLESFKILDKVVKRNTWLTSINKGFETINDLKRALDDGKKLTSTNEDDIRLLQKLEEEYKTALKAYEKFEKIKNNNQKISYKELMILKEECQTLPLDEINVFISMLITEYESIKDTVLPIIKLIKEKNSSIKDEEDFVKKIQIFVKYSEKIGTGIFPEYININSRRLLKFEEFEEESKLFTHQLMEEPQHVNNVINIKFNDLLDFGRDDFNFSSMSKSDCLKYLASYNMDILNSNEERYCVCRQMHEGNMVECETCKQWFHFNCIGYVGSGEQDDNSKYICPLCDYDNKYSTTNRFYQYVYNKHTFEELFEFSNKMITNCCIIEDYGIEFLHLVAKLWSFYENLIQESVFKVVKTESDEGEDEIQIIENDKAKLRKLLQKIGGCTIEYKGLHQKLRSIYCQLCKTV